MAKVQIKYEKLTPFGGIFGFRLWSNLISFSSNHRFHLGIEMHIVWLSIYSEILRSLMCVYLCGGSCVEDISTHLMKHLSLHPTLRTCSAI